MQHAATSVGVSFEHVVEAQKTLALLASYSPPVPLVLLAQKAALAASLAASSAASAPMVEHLALACVVSAKIELRRVGIRGGGDRVGGGIGGGGDAGDGGIGGGGDVGGGGASTQSGAAFSPVHPSAPPPPSPPPPGILHHSATPSAALQSL